MKQIRNTIQKSTHYSSENYNSIVAFQEAIGAKSLSEAVNVLLERAFENLNYTTSMFEQFESLIKSIKKEIAASKEETISQSNRLVSVINTGYRLQARTYGICKKAEEHRLTFHPDNWNNINPEDRENRQKANISCNAFEQKAIKDAFELLKKPDANQGVKMS